ncbi:MAG: LysM peptidoglycan-binding domain-containing protein [Flavobacteriales bacterium]|nr:LysM peptidoglycan-binding domain-containing protein [Flavobacteriales bacterium]
MGITKIPLQLKYVKLVVFMTGLMLCCTPGQTSAQVDQVSDTIVENGKTFKRVYIEKGMTLYALSRKYGVEITQILDDNEEVKKKGLKEGQWVLIPVASSPIKKNKQKMAENRNPPDVKTGPAPRPTGFTYHTVEKGETMYSIAREYGLTIDRITMENPELRQDGLKAGMELRIPVVAAERIAMEDWPAPDSTVNGLFPDTNLAAPGNYNLALFLPLYLDENDTLRKKRLESTQPADHPYAQESVMALDFYQGFLVAGETMKNVSSKFSVKVFDTAGDSAIVSRTVRTTSLDRCDLIIGPWSAKPFSALDPYLKSHPVDVVSPFLSRERGGNDSAAFVQLSSTSESHVKALARHTSKHVKKHNILVVHLSTDEDIRLKDTYVRTLYGLVDSSKVKLKVINYSKERIEGVRSSLSATDTNVVFFVCREYALISDLVSKLNYTRLKSKGQVIVLMGLHNWLNMENIDVAYFHNLYLHIPRSFNINYTDSAVGQFVNAYRERFHREPTNFSFMGYDLSLYCLTMLHRYGRHPFQYATNLTWEGLQTSFTLAMTRRNVWDNQYSKVFVLKDFELIPAEQFSLSRELAEQQEKAQGNRH